MTVEIIVPFYGAGADRTIALDWVSSRWPYAHRIAPDAGELPHSKGRALWPAVRDSDADIIVLHDADVWCPGLPEAVQAVIDGHAWAVPHDRVHRLSQDGTARLLEATEGWSREPLMAAGVDWRRLPLAQPPYQGVLGGGILVASRSVLLEAPVDGRFLDWGQEDEAHGIALHCLHGRAWRGDADLMHLWHPPQPRMSRRVGTRAGYELCSRYRAARRDPVKMRALVAEARDMLRERLPAGVS